MCVCVIDVACFHTDVVQGVCLWFHALVLLQHDVYLFELIKSITCTSLTVPPTVIDFKIRLCLGLFTTYGYLSLGYHPHYYQEPLVYIFVQVVLLIAVLLTCIMCSLSLSSFDTLKMNRSRDSILDHRILSYFWKTDGY